MNARCDVCGSPVGLSHDGVFVCTRDRMHQHSVDMAFGGPGSGWHRSKGHVPGSQSGKGGSKDGAGGRQKAAASAHGAAAEAHEKAAQDSDARGPGNFVSWESSRTAQTVTNRAHKASKETGAGELFESKAAKTYAKMAQNTADSKEAAKYHREAAKYHRGAANAHTTMAKTVSASKSGEPSDVGKNAWKLNSKLTQASNPLNRGGKTPGLPNTSSYPAWSGFRKVKK